ncbi:OpgC domain-containing protein [Altericroceibacterium xinjiangense]|uniref:OpgC domain-containing protein n=1 Tax=Altericroceibacterium xinjiangense TaxID=762261 RepID=UPI0013DFBD16|nr:OpgC domain-containing protein [Altericroceibacterium xinjiangense]
MLKSTRLDQLDFLRGFALITIILNHYSSFVVRAGYSGQIIPTLSSVGFSSSAPLFFMTSGLLIGLIYFNVRNQPSLIRISATLFNRAMMLLAMNCVLFVLVLATFSFAPHVLQEIFQLQSLGDQPYRWAYDAIALRYNLPLLDILNVYVLMMLVAIPFVWLANYSSSIALLMIIGAYLVAQFFPEFSLPGGNPWSTGRWVFNPLAWGGFFLGGLLAGRFNLHERLRQVAVSPARGRSLTCLLVLAYCILAIVFRLHSSGIIEVPATDKSTMQPVRLFHAILTFVMLLTLLFRYEGLRRFVSYRKAYESVVLVGKHSLHSFMATVALNYIMLLLWLQVGGVASYIGIGLAGVIALVFFAKVLEVLKSARAGKFD